MNILYLKESPTGLKYLGKCKDRNPITYMGSGKYWKLHLKKHKFTSKDIKTIILLQTNDQSELIETGLYYSELWDIVKNEEFANLKPEKGDGGWEHLKGVPKTKEWRDMMSNRIRSVEERQNLSLAKQGIPLSETHKDNLRASHLGIIYSDETNKKRGLAISKTKKGKALTVEHKDALKKPKNKEKNNTTCKFCGVYTTKTVISRKHGENKCK